MAHDPARTGDGLAARLAELTALAAWEWQLGAFDGDRLTLLGGQDLSSAHFAEAHLSGVTYLSCPTRMMHARFRLASDHEATLARLQAEVPPGSSVIAIDSDTTSSFEAVSLIVAASVDITILRR
jgi:hypothetical protein